MSDFVEIMLRCYSDAKRMCGDDNNACDAFVLSQLQKPLYEWREKLKPHSNLISVSPEESLMEASAVMLCVNLLFCFPLLICRFKVSQHPQSGRVGPGDARGDVSDDTLSHPQLPDDSQRCLSLASVCQDPGPVGAARRCRGFKVC